MVAIPFSSGPSFVRTLRHDPSILGGPNWHGSWFHWARQGLGPCDQFGQISVMVVFSLSALWWRRIRDLWKTPDGRDWLREKLGLVLMGGAVFSKSLIQFSVDGQGYVPSLLLDLRPNYGGGNEDNGNLLLKVPCTHCYTRCLRPWSRPPPTHVSTEDSWTLTGKSGSISCGVTAPLSWVLVCTGFCPCPPRAYFPVLGKFWQLYGGVNGALLQEGLCHNQVYLTQSPWGRPLLTHTPVGDTQTQFWLSFWGLGVCFCSSQV